jgi:hypothetical protein
MIEHSLDTTNSILLVRPKSALEQADFAQLAKTADPQEAARQWILGRA